MLTSVVLPLPERPKTAVMPGVGAAKDASRVNSGRFLTTATLSTGYGPSNRRTRRTRSSAARSPARPSANDSSASRSASASPVGDCIAV